MDAGDPLEIEARREWEKDQHILSTTFCGVGT